MTKNLEEYIYLNDDGSKSIFLKFSSYEVIENMIKGELWFRHVGYFRFYPDKCGRADEFDGFKGVSYNAGLNDFGGNTYITIYNQDDNSNEKERVICIYEWKLNKDHFEYQIDEKMKCLGNYCALVDVNEL